MEGYFEIVVISFPHEHTYNGYEGLF